MSVMDTTATISQKKNPNNNCCHGLVIWLGPAEVFMPSIGSLANLISGTRINAQRRKSSAFCQLGIRNAFQSNAVAMMKFARAKYKKWAAFIHARRKCALILIIYW